MEKKAVRINYRMTETDQGNFKTLGDAFKIDNSKLVRRAFDILRRRFNRVGLQAEDNFSYWLEKQFKNEVEEK